MVWFENVIAKVCLLACYLGGFVFAAFFMSCFSYLLSVHTLSVLLQNLENRISDNVRWISNKKKFFIEAWWCKKNRSSVITVIPCLHK